ncbi:MAG: RNA polymerase sporulation sigma factor SigH [Clostridia bacterium]
MANQHSFDSMNDEDIVLSAQGGDEEALDYILHKFRPRVAKKAKSYFLAGADGDDIIQEGMIGLFKAVRDYKCGKDASFRSFAELCITRQIISAVKSASRLKHSPLNTYVSLDRPCLEDNSDSTLLDVIAGDNAANPEDIVIGKANKKQVEIKMGEVLSPLECKVLSLYLKGESYSAIASHLKKDVKSIDNALQRVKKKFEKFSDDFS